MRRTADTRRLLARGLAFEAAATPPAVLPADLTGGCGSASGPVSWRLRRRGREATGEVWVTRPDGSVATRFVTVRVLPASEAAAATAVARCATVLALAAAAVAAVESARDARRSLA